MFFSQDADDPQYCGAVRRMLDQVGRVHLSGFLEPRTAQFMADEMQGVDWRLITNQGGATQDIVPADAEREAAVMHALGAEARTNFRFAYYGYRLSDACLAQTLTYGPFYDFFLYLNSPDTIELFRAITGEPRIVYLDAMISRYRPGHFLTAHTDEEAGGERLFAYVFNFCRGWRPDWGGLLTFLSQDGHVIEGYTPRMGALNIFRVPQPHAVTLVAPFAGADRYSITGWMRAVRPGLKAASG